MFEAELSHRAKKLESESSSRARRSNRRKRMERLRKKRAEDAAREREARVRKEREEEIARAEAIAREKEEAMDIVQKASRAYALASPSANKIPLYEDDRSKGKTFRTRVRALDEAAERRVGLLKRKYALLTAKRNVEQWSCAKCTFRNEASAHVCGACGSHRGTSEVPSLTRASLLAAAASGTGVADEPRPPGDL